MIDDVPIEQSGLVQVIQRLLYGVRSLCSVGLQGRDIVRLDEVQVVVDVGKLLLGNLVGHEIGKYLFGPYIIKPPHRHQIAEPHVTGFVGYQVQAVHFLVGCGMLAQEERGIAELDAAGMLHAAKLIAGQCHASVFLEGVGNARIVFHPSERERYLVEQLWYLCHLLRIGLSI